MKAWIIKWDWAGDHAKVEYLIVAVPSARRSPKHIQRYVQQRYIEETASLAEMLAYTRYAKPEKHTVAEPHDVLLELIPKNPFCRRGLPDSKYRSNRVLKAKPLQ